MADIIDDLYQWFTERPEWQQDAVRRLLQQTELSNDDIKQLADLCLKEAGFDHPDMEILEFRPVVKTALTFEVGRCNLFLKSIGDVKGINALAPHKALEFGAGLTVVYGANGSGKSGYTRILKAVAGIPSKTALLGNVFADQPTEQSCSLEYVLNDTPQQKITWQPDSGPKDHLSAIALYDTELGNVYVNEENEVAIEPAPVALLRRLAEVCSAVVERMKGERKNMRSSKLKLPFDYSETEYGKRYNALNASTTEDQVSALCAWSEELEEKLKKVDERYRAPGAGELVSQVGKRHYHRKQILEIFKNCVTKLSQEAAHGLTEARKEAASKKQAASDAAKRVFADAPLGEVGSQTWRQLWECARAYSELEAYPGLAFPYVEVDARCVLCQQPLADEADKKRLVGFEDFVKSRASSEAQTAENRVAALVNGLPNVVLWETLEPLIMLSGIEKPESIEALKTYRQSLEDRENALVEGKSLDEIPDLPKAQVVEALQTSLTKLEGDLKQHQEDAKKDNRDHILKELRELQCQKWCSGELYRLRYDNSFLKMVVAWDKAEKLCDTGSITSKNGSLYKELVTDEYLDRFATELTGLGGDRIKVHLAPTKNAKAVSYYKVSLNDPKLNASVAAILSEGEQRLVSIAAFLADLTGRDGSAPFVFDDPISSLDEEFEALVAERLIALASSQQVVVFTHRLSLLEGLTSGAKETLGKERFSAVSITALGGRPGQPTGVPLWAKSASSALAQLKDHRLAVVRKAAEDPEQYEVLCRALCTDIRITVERLIESELLLDVVNRFRRDLQTKGRLEHMHHIVKDDCDMFDRLMSRYSGFKHSQPKESPIPLPEPELLAQDLQALVDWEKSYKARRTAKVPASA